MINDYYFFCNLKNLESSNKSFDDMMGVYKENILNLEEM